MKKWTFCTSDGLEKYHSFVKDLNTRIAAFLHFDSQAGVEMGNKGRTVEGTKLAGIPFAVKDNIAVRSMPLTCGSKFLENFVSPYSATAVERLLACGAMPVGKTNLDEFGMGSSTDNSALQQTNNPWDLERVSGGSSGGSAAAVAAGMVPFALGSDTGGSVRQPAAFCGVYGLKPTYGSVSRYGLVAYASSLDVIGVIADSPEWLRIVFESIRGRDKMDQSSVDFHDFPPEKKRVRRVGVLTNNLNVSDEIAQAYGKTAEFLEKSGYELKNVELPSIEYTAAVYHTIAAAEASANLARYNGIRYGTRPVYSNNPDELVRHARNAGFGDEVKLRILLGTYVLRSGFQDQYYQKAQKIRKKMRQDFNALFSQIDTLLMPVFPVQAFRHDDNELDDFQQRIADRFTAIANLTGVPALSCPVGLAKGLPCAVQFLAPAFHEHLLFELSERLREGFPVLKAPGYEGFAWSEE